MPALRFGMAPARRLSFVLFLLFVVHFLRRTALAVTALDHRKRRAGRRPYSDRHFFPNPNPRGNCAFRVVTGREPVPHNGVSSGGAVVSASRSELNARGRLDSRAASISHAVTAPKNPRSVWTEPRLPDGSECAYHQLRGAHISVKMPGARSAQVRGTQRLRLSQSEWAARNARRASRPRAAVRTSARPRAGRRSKRPRRRNGRASPHRRTSPQRPRSRASPQERHSRARPRRPQDRARRPNLHERAAT